METIIFLLAWGVLATFLAGMILLTWAICARDRTAVRPPPIIVNDRPKPDLRVVTNPPVIEVRNVITNVRYPINN